MYFFNPDERMTKDLTPAIRARTFWGENVMLAVVDLDAYAVLPTHSHPHEQGGIILRGELEFTVGDEKRSLRAGDLYMIPGGTEHSVRVGPQPAQVLDIFAPVREDLKY